MLDKSYTFQAISLVLKRDILPNLTNDMAKEQTIAILSLLKNLDANSVPNEEPYKSVNALLFEELTDSLEKMCHASTIKHKDKLAMFQENLVTIAKEQQSERQKWEVQNQLFAELIQFAYKNSEFQPVYGDI